MKTLQFVAMVLTALALVPGGAHLFALPNKIHLRETDTSSRRASIRVGRFSASF
jgi:hypothetical protein